VIETWEDDNRKLHPDPWVPSGSPLVLGIAGKLCEEATEAAKVCSRIIIQGLAGIDPSTGLTNREELQKEIADLEHMIEFAKREFFLDEDKIAIRRSSKTAFHLPWIQFLKNLAIRGSK